MADRSLRLFIGVAGGKAVGMVFGILATVLVGRLLGPRGLGQWSLLLAAGTLLHTGLVNWTHASTVRYGREEWVLAGSLNRTLGARLPLLAATVTLALLLVVLQPIHWAERWFAAERSGWWMIGLFALSVWLAAEAQATLQATDRIMWQAVVAPLVSIGTAAALMTLFWSESPSLAAAVRAFTAIPIAGWGGAWLWALARSNTRPSQLQFDDVVKHLRYGAPIVPTFAFGYVSDWGDHLLLSRFSSVAQVGLFGIPYQFMVLAMTVNGVLSTLLLPRLIAQELQAPGSIRTYVDTEAPTLFGLWMIGSIWLVAAMPVLVRLLTGPAFDESVGLLLALLIVVPASVITSLYTVLFSIQERMARSLVYVGLMTLVNVMVSLILIPTHGALGAAIGTVLSYVVYQALYIWDQHRELAVPPRRIWTLWAAGLALGVIQDVMGPRVGMRLAWCLIATALVVMIVRTEKCVDASVVRRLFAGRLSSVGALVNCALVTRT